MKAEEVQKIFEDVGAIRTGHFELSSGLHSAKYVQCALVLQYPEHAQRLGKALAECFQGNSISCVVAPAMGGITIGYEVARALGLRSLWVERDRSGEMALRRGWELAPGERVLVVEDVWTTGGSTRETMGVVEKEGGIVVAAGALIDRTGGRFELNVPTRSLLQMEIASYDPADCPLCRTGSVTARPGSRPGDRPGDRMTRAQHT